MTDVLPNDLRLELRTRNNRLWHLIFDTYESVADFCRIHDLPQGEVGEFLNLTRSPYVKSGQPRLTAETLATLGQMLVEDLFPKDLYRGLFPTRMATEIPSRAYCGLSAAKHLALPPAQEDTVLQQELHTAMAAALETITPRERRILRARFGLDDGSDGRTLEDIGEENGINRERVRQIEAKALRKLRHPSRSRKLRPYLKRAHPVRVDADDSTPTTH